MEISKELQEVIEVVRVDHSLEHLIDDWDTTIYLPEELQEKNEQFYKVLIQYKEMVNQWLENNLTKENDGDKEEENEITH